MFLLLVYPFPVYLYLLVIEVLNTYLCHAQTRREDSDAE